jgi:hypothetical protein
MILENFKVYDEFLSALEGEDKTILLSLKMMYSIHMENIKAENNIFFLLKQLVRFLVKFVGVSFFKVGLQSSHKVPKCAIIANSRVEEYVADKGSISLVSVEKYFSVNLDSVRVYTSLFRSLYLLFRSPSLKKVYIFALSHRLIDYLMTFHTIDLGEIKVLMMENDRTPVNMAMLHLAKEKGCKTVKYDNWLIDPINHNDVYCEYYYYPSLYHKKIIQGFDSNRELQFIEGGFLYWDKLAMYKPIEKKEQRQVIYFTQVGIPADEHRVYIEDIEEAMCKSNVEYELIIKIHPRENINMYQGFLNKYKVIERHDSLYELIARSAYCFSMFSTISLEAKHIIKNSFFINYKADLFNIVDYDSIQLDVIKNKSELLQVFKGKYMPIAQEKFIEHSNCNYPHSSEKLRKFFCHD